jgi:hypothetical protein
MRFGATMAILAVIGLAACLSSGSGDGGVVTTGGPEGCTGCCQVDAPLCCSDPDAMVFCDYPTCACGGLHFNGNDVYCDPCPDSSLDLPDVDHRGRADVGGVEGGDGSADSADAAVDGNAALDGTSD